MNMREKTIKNTIICAYKNLKTKAYKKIVGINDIYGCYTGWNYIK